MGVHPPQNGGIGSDRPSEYASEAGQLHDRRGSRCCTRVGTPQLRRAAAAATRCPAAYSIFGVEPDGSTWSLHDPLKVDQSPFFKGHGPGDSRYGCVSLEGAIFRVALKGSQRETLYLLVSQCLGGSPPKNGLHPRGLFSCVNIRLLRFKPPFKQGGHSIRGSCNHHC